MCQLHGGPLSQCGDEHVQWFPQRTICYASMERVAAQWRYAELHDKKPFHDGSFENWSDKRSLDFPYAASDGVTIWVSDTDLNPHDHFLGGKADCAECSTASGVDGVPDAEIDA